MKSSLLSFANFNPVALFSLILLAIGVILGAVSVGIGQWSRLETVRTDEGVQDGSTMKTVGLLDRCVSYVITTEILELGLSLDQQPMSGCSSVAAVNCSQAGLPLVSALDVFGHPEIHNSYSQGSCNEVKTNLQVSATFMILAVVGSFIAMCLYFPLWHWGVFIAGAIIAVLSVICCAVGLGVFIDTSQDFAGFFSMNGLQQDGCLSYGFGIALAAFIINTIASAIGIVAIFYKQLCSSNRNRQQ